MPIIAMFLGILIRMRYDDHLPPHFHAEYQGHKAVFNLEGEMTEGDMPPKQRKYIAAWADFHKEELRANWIASSEHAEMFRIDPLRF